MKKPATRSPKDQLVLPFRNKKAFATWLAKNGSKVDGLWIRFAKKASGIPTVTYDEALDVSLCYGWIDGLRKSESDDYFVQWFTPRRKNSLWSKRNQEKVKALIESGEMQPAGHAEIERAKSDGRWGAAYDGPRKITVPPDLQEVFDKKPKLKKFFDSLNSQNRYAILFRLQSAKKPETRAKRFALFVEMLSKGEKIYP
jgi:uncharacterized protein YdeI (YjbR/CyaY-like superfamily)